VARPVQTQTRPLTAVYDDDLEGLLASLGELTAVKGGQRRCKFSEDTISIDNLHAIFPESGTVKYVCNKPACAVALASRVGSDDTLKS
jgi:hypothetical protein